MSESENSVQFEKRKHELVINSIELLEKLYSRGPISLENYFSTNNNKFKDKVYDYYKKGLELIINGKPPKQVAFMLEYEKIKWIKKSNVTEEDLLLITIIQGIVPYLQELDFESIYDLCSNFFFGRELGKIQDLLLKINPHIWEKYL